MKKITFTKFSHRNNSNDEYGPISRSFNASFRDMGGLGSSSSNAMMSRNFARINRGSVQTTTTPSDTRNVSILLVASKSEPEESVVNEGKEEEERLEEGEDILNEQTALQMNINLLVEQPEITQGPIPITSSTVPLEEWKRQPRELNKPQRALSVPALHEVYCSRCAVVISDEQTQKEPRYQFIEGTAGSPPKVNPLQEHRRVILASVVVLSLVFMSVKQVGSKSMLVSTVESIWNAVKDAFRSMIPA